MVESWGSKKRFPYLSTFLGNLALTGHIPTFPSLGCCSETSEQRTLTADEKCQPCPRSKVSTMSPAAHSARPLGLDVKAG